MYLAHGWHLAFYDEPLVSDEYAEAWQYGPVFSSLYHEFKHRGRLPIVDPATDMSLGEPTGKGSYKIQTTTPKVDPSDTQTIDLLDEIWKVYGNRSGMALSGIIHRDGSPWEQTWTAANGRKNANIDGKVIKEHYIQLGWANAQKQRA